MKLKGKGKGKGAGCEPTPIATLINIKPNANRNVTYLRIPYPMFSIHQ